MPQLILLMILFVFCSGQVLATDIPFEPVWFDESAQLSDEDLGKALDGISKQVPDPQHVVVLVHGFATTQGESANQYSTLAPLIKEQFQKSGKSVAVVGVQWDSVAGGFIFKLPGQYWRKQELATKTGRYGLRKLLFGIQDRYPSTQVSIFAHSMGCQLSEAALNPDWDYDKSQESKIEDFRPKEDLQIHALVLAGSDLDYDVAYRSRAKTARSKLVWMTLSRVVVPTRFLRDRILDLRKIVRGTAAGATFPRFTEEQYDHIFKSQLAIFDNESIPPSHSFVLYYDQARLQRIVPALLYKADPQTAEKPEVFRQLDLLMAAPNEVEALKPWLDNSQITVQIAAIWRLEHLVCEGSKHLADETLLHLGKALNARPRWVKRRRNESECKTVQQKIWPTSLGFERAGAPDWAKSMGGSDWRRDFRGEITSIEDDWVTLKTDRFEQVFSFEIVEEQTQFTPSRAALKVGSKVEVTVDNGHELRQLEIVPFSRWLSRKKQS